MVCTVSAIKNAGAASAYYSQTDDYYRERGHAPTAWYGKAAEALGLRGEVSTAQAEAMLEGRLPNGERVGGDDHRPGWDLTFSAPKSVSVAAYIYGDDRLIAAHDAAVRDALAYIEREVAATRIRENNEVRTETTGNIVAATYRHDVSRDGEPDIHTHGVLMNVTQSADGKYRSLESKPLYRIQTEAGAVYRASLARSCEKIGWQTEKTMAGKHPSFELSAISAAERELFSSRSKQIERELEKMGLTRETATAEQKQVAALATRQQKQEIDRAHLLDTWREQARAAGFGETWRPEAREIKPQEYVRRADAAVRDAVAHLSERETRFTERQIASEARKSGMGQIDDRDITAAVARAAARHELPRTTTRQFDIITGQKQLQAGFTTREAQQTELSMLARADRAVGAVRPAMSAAAADAAIRAQETKTGFAFNDSQSAATRAVLTGSDRITLIQGYAGTAKTTSVLAASAAALRQQGYDVVALAPTHSAAKTLGDSIGAESRTVARFLAMPAERADSKTIYMVDEFSMLSARDTEKLLARTEGGRLVGVGDVKQLGSVEAGAAFRQLQTESKLPTQVLDVIVRQRNHELRAAVYDAIKGDIRGALSKIHVVELKTRAERIDYIASRYAALPAAERAKRVVIAPGRDDRREINDAVRVQLAARGELGASTTIRALDSRDMTAVEQRRAASYAVGDRLIAGRDYKSLGLQKGESAQVVAVDVNKNRVTIKNDSGREKAINPAKFTKLAAHELRVMEVAVGDRIVSRENTDDIKNGVVLRVEKIDRNHIHARDDAGKLHKLDARELHKLDHSYAQTGHESQGRSAFGGWLHAESARVNLMSQQNFYVPVSRATDEFVIVTDDRARLAEQIERESGQKETALDRNPIPVSESDSQTYIRNTHPNPIPNPKHVSESTPAPAPAPTPAPWDAPAPAENVRDPHILDSERADAPTPEHER